MDDPSRFEHTPTPLAQFASWARQPLVRAFRVTASGRTALVEQMLARQVHEAPMYWLQLILAMSIATLGLALGSNVVVIGAMLISPLMNPIVELGMGLAVGLPVLAGRSFVRIAISACIVVLGATLITLALPFHEVTAPIAARAAPTLLDLLIATCCAIMASFATAVAGSATTTTAAGTAVAIALVPPLCVVGFGLGTGQATIARGAALLFTANFSAIMLFAVITFTAFGFGQEGSLRDARAPAGTGPFAVLQRYFAAGGTLRILLPIVLLAMVFLPLRRALEQVAWEVRTRQAVRHELDALSQETVRSSVDIAERAVRIQLVIIGNAEKADGLQRRLALRVAAVAGVVPTVEVLAVPDAEAMHQALQIATPAKPELNREHDLTATTARITQVLERSWPISSAGPLVGWRADFSSASDVHMEVAHFGDPIGAAAEQILGRNLSEITGNEVRVIDVVLPNEPIVSPPGEGPTWLSNVVPLLSEVSRFSSLYVCIGVPEGSHTRNGDGGEVLIRTEQVRAAAQSAIASSAFNRVYTAAAPLWSLRVQTERCPEESVDSGSAGDALTDSDSKLVDAGIEKQDDD